jgi:hypothetical protein
VRDLDFDRERDESGVNRGGEGGAGYEKPGVSGAVS